MKEFKSVTIKNFFSYGNKEQTLELDGKDIWNISGSNGKGKTAICVEAITFAIYGKHREEKIDDCVNRSVGKNCMVRLKFVGDDDETYTIERYRKDDARENSVVLYKGDKDISLKNAKDTDALIQDLIGMPYTAFINSTIFSSELYSSFLRAKNSERLVVFENILSLKEIGIFYSEIKKILKELAEDEETANINYNAAKGGIDALKKQLEDYTSSAKEKLLSLKAEKENAKKTIENTEKELSELKVLDVAKEKGKLSNNVLKEEYEKQILSKTKELNLLNVNEPTVEIAIVEKYKDFDFTANKIKEEKYKKDSETITMRENGAEKFNSQLSSLRISYRVLETEKKNYEEQLSKQQKDLESIKSAICPYCGQTMDKEETEKKRETVSKKIEELENSIKEVSKEQEDLNVQIKDAQESYASLINEVNLIKQSLDKGFAANSDLEEQKFLNAKKAVEEYKERKFESETKKASLKDEIIELGEKRNKLEISPYTEDYLNSVEEKVTLCEKQINEANIKIAEIDGSVKAAYDKSYVEKTKKTIEEQQVSVDELKAKTDEVQKLIRHYEYLGECCSNKSGGFKKFFINEMIPMFNELVNKYLPFFFGDKKVEIEFDKDLNDEIKVDGVKVSFSSFSRGQKSRAEIATAFALFSLSRIFFSNKSGLLVVDELLDNGLDDLGIKSSVSVLQSFAQDSKVFVVSHNPVVKENIDNVIEIKTDGSDFSYIA